MTPTTAQLENEVRLITDRVNDPTLTSATIITYLNDAVRSLYDLFLDSVPHWVQGSFDFTLTGDTEETSFIALPDDFQVDLGLDWLNPPGVTYPLTIRRLPTFLDRNRLNPYNTLALSPAFYNRNYEVQGANVQLYPKMNCGGDYRLYYQKQIDPLALPVTQDIVIAGASDNLFAPTTIPTFVSAGALASWVFANADLADVPVDGTATLTVALTTPNNIFDGTYPILATLSPPNSSFPEIGTALPADSTGWTGPEAGAASITYQPVGTLAALPRVFAPWQLYVKTFAAISVLTSFNENADALQARLAQETARVKRMAEKRESDLRQVPILSGGRGADSPNYDNGGGWGGSNGGDW